MGVVKIVGFKGRYPGVERRYIPENAATIATDVKLGYGDIRPLLGYEDQNYQFVRRRPNETAPRAMFLYQSQYWMHWHLAASFVSSPIGEDEWERVMFSVDEDDENGSWPLLVAGATPSGPHEVTTGSGPYPYRYRALGVPVPPSPPSAVRTAGDLGDVEDQRTVYYAFTQVNDRGEESAPSTPSVAVVINEGLGFTVTVTCQATTDITADSRGTTYRAPRRTRLYRLTTSGDDSSWLFVAEKFVGGGGVTVFTDTTATEFLDGDAMVSQTWLPPPVGLKGLRMLPNGGLVAFRGNEVCFSEPGYPYAWPVRYRYAVDTPIVGIGVFGSSVAALTTAQPYLLLGAHGADMTPVKMEANQSCVSARSIVDFGDRVVWASPNGLFSIGANGVEAITTGFMDKITWKTEFVPTTIHAYSYEGRYIAFYEGGGGDAGFVVNVYVPDDGLINLSTTATAAHNDLETDTLYVSQPKNTFYGVFAFDTDANNPFEWEWCSRVCEFPAHEAPGCAQVLGTGYPFEIDTAVLDDQGVKTMIDVNRSVTSRNAIRLSAGTLAADWMIAVRGTTQCESLILATVVDEIKRV